jgi:5-enolpyruvylshikimate-3-phosphate synthase
MSIKLPISKSIANRILLLQAIHGDPLMRVSSDMPDDVHILHDALEALRQHRNGEPLTLWLGNCGTALRFLQVHIAKCYPNEPITLTGDPRLMERDGKPTSQTTSALILHGEDIPVEKNESPYITMSRKIAEAYPNVELERDWSSAAFWYEYIAIHGGELLLESLKRDSLQGDKMVAQLYNHYFGVITSYLPEGVKISKSSVPVRDQVVAIDFENIPDLYPSIALTCERLKLSFQATGTSRLRFKESNRLRSVRLHEVNNDHRMAMALLCADYPVSIEEQACIAKSYPNFAPQHITPIRGVNDEGKGKKFALSKLIHAATSDYVWLHDDDIVLPPACAKAVVLEGNLIILPLKMESENAAPSLLERLQIAEYAAIQELTMRTAKRNQAIMCSGANLIVRREVWLACESDLHPEIPSGDDMFLLEAAKRRGYKISVMDEPDYTAIVRPQTTWKAFLRQRMRWAGKAPHYTDRDIRRYGAIIVAANLAQLLFFPIILIKFPIEYGLIKNREPRTPWYVALLLEILYPIYMLVAFFGGLVRTNRW